jgi:hypothetical protein
MLFMSATMTLQYSKDIEDMIGQNITDKIWATPKEMSKRNVKFQLSCCSSMAHTAREHVAKVFAKSVDDKVVIYTNFKHPIPDIVDFVHGIANDKCGLDHNLITLELFGNLTPQDKCGRTAIFCNAPTIDSNICRCARALVATNLASVGLDNKKIALLIHDGLPRQENLLSFLDAVKFS